MRKPRTLSVLDDKEPWRNHLHIQVDDKGTLFLNRNDDFSVVLDDTKKIQKVVNKLNEVIKWKKYKK